MLKKHCWKFVVAVMITVLIAGVGLVPNATAVTFNTVDVSDCDVLGASGPFDNASENMGAGSGGANRLFLTWDATNLYIGFNNSIGVFSIYLDTALNGTYVPSWGAATTFNIAAAPNGYEHSLTFLGPTPTSPPLHEVSSSGTAWVPGAGLMTTSCNAAPATPGHTEIAIPWGSIGFTGVPSERVTVLATSRIPDANTVYQVWPGTPNTTTGFTVGYVINDPINSPNISPNVLAQVPTAISLSQFAANNPQASLLLLVGVLVLGTGAAIFLRCRNRKQEI